MIESNGSLQDVEDLMKRELRTRSVYEYPRGGLYREHNAGNPGNGNQGANHHQAQAAPRGGGAGANPPRGGGGGGGRGGAGRGRGGAKQVVQPEKYGIAYDPSRNPNHLKEKIGKVRQLGRGRRPVLILRC